jgi:hypothetical protein
MIVDWEKLAQLKSTATAKVSYFKQSKEHENADGIRLKFRSRASGMWSRDWMRASKRCRRVSDSQPFINYASRASIVISACSSREIGQFAFAPFAAAMKASLDAPGMRAVRSR